MDMRMRHFHAEYRHAYPLARYGVFHRDGHLAGEIPQAGICLLIKMEDIVILQMLGDDQGVPGRHRSYVKDQNIALNKDQAKKTSKSQSFLLAPPKKQKRIVKCPNGIVRFLKQSNVNVVPTASSSKSNSTAPQNAIDGEDSTYFLSKGVPNQWWQIDFVKRVRVDSYLPTNNGSWSPANWVVEVSDDAHLWNIIDVQQSSNFIKNKTRFNIENPVECRYLRFRMTGKTTDGHDDIIIYNIEFYGAVITED